MQSSSDPINDGDRVTRDDQTRVETSKGGFNLVLVYLAFEYVRPQDIFPIIGYLHPAWFLVPLMVMKWPKGGFRLARCPQISVMLVVSIILVLGVPLAANHYRAYQTAVGYVFMVPFCISIILFVNTPQRLISFVRWWTYLSVYVACGSIIHPGGMDWGSGFLGDRNDVALLLVIMLPFALGMFAYEQRKARKITFLAVVLLCLAGAISTTSRGGFVGLLAVAIVLWLMSPRKVLTLTLVALLSFATYRLAPQSYWDRISTVNETDQGTARGRLDSWMSAWRMFKDHPLGVGGGQFGIHFPEYQGDAFGAHSMWGREAHSLWFTLLAELGIPGAVLYAIHIRANWKALWRLRKPRDERNRRFAHLLSMAFFASFAGFFAAATFLSVLYYPHYWYMSAMLVAAGRSLGSVPQSLATSAPPSAVGALSSGQ